MALSENNNFNTHNEKTLDSMNTEELISEFSRLKDSYNKIKTIDSEKAKELKAILEITHDLINSKNGYDLSIKFEASNKEDFEKQLKDNIDKIPTSEIIDYIYSGGNENNGDFGEYLYEKIGINSLLKLPKRIKEYKQMSIYNTVLEDALTVGELEYINMSISNKIKNIIDLNDKLINEPNENFLDSTYKGYVRLLTNKNKVLEIADLYAKKGEGYYISLSDISPTLVNELFFNKNIIITHSGGIEENLSTLNKDFIEKNFKAIVEKTLTEVEGSHYDENIQKLYSYAIFLNIDGKILKDISNDFDLNKNFKDNIIIQSYLGNTKEVEDSFIKSKNINELDGGEISNNLRLDFIKEFINKPDFTYNSNKYLDEETIVFLAYNVFKGGHYNKEFGDVIIEILEKTDTNAIGILEGEDSSSNAISLYNLPIPDERFIKLLIHYSPNILPTVPNELLKGKDMLSFFLDNYDFQRDENLIDFRKFLPKFEITDINAIIQVFGTLQKKLSKFSDITNPNYNQEKTESDFIKMFFIDPQMRGLLNTAYTNYNNTKLEKGDGYDSEAIFYGLANIVVKNGELLNKHLGSLKNINQKIGKVEDIKDSNKKEFLKIKVWTNLENYFKENQYNIPSSVLPNSKDWRENTKFSLDLYSNIGVHVINNPDIPNDKKDEILKKVYSDILKIINDSLIEENSRLSEKIDTKGVKNSKLLSRKANKDGKVLLDKDGNPEMILSQDEIRKLFLKQIKGKHPSEIIIERKRFIEENFDLQKLSESDYNTIMKILENIGIITNNENIINNYDTFKRWYDNGQKGDFNEYLENEKKQTQKRQNSNITNYYTETINPNFNEKEGVLNYNGESLKLEVFEQEYIKKGQEKLVTSFYDKLKETGLTFLWEKRGDIFDILGGIDKFNAGDGNYINENEIKTFFNGVLKLVGNNEGISKSEPLGEFIKKIKEINKVKYNGDSAKNLRGDTIIEGIIRKLYMPDSGIGFKKEIAKKVLYGEKQLPNFKELKTGNFKL